jgi:multiple sugar transport system permease protein
MKDSTTKNLLTYPGIALALAFCLLPFVYMAAVSLAGRADLLAADVPFSFTLENFRAVLTDSSLHFIAYFRNSILISLASAVICVTIASLAAYAITRLAFPGRMSLLFFALAVSMFPQIGIVGYLYKLMASVGWVNTPQALILPYVAWILPLSLWILVSYFSQIPRELDKAAFIDGCTYHQTLLRIVLPVAAPGVFSVFLLSFIFAFNEFMFALMLTTSYKARTIPVGIALFQGLHGQTPWGNIMAASVITTLPVVILTLIFQRRIIGGLTSGALKG